MKTIVVSRTGGIAVACLVVSAVLAGCGPRVLIATGTTIGLKANPGDPEGGRSPQVTLGYKRAEAALIATKGTGATQNGEDAYSTFASFGFKTEWFGDTELTSFIATGFAARALTAPDVEASGAAPSKAAPPKGAAPKGAAPKAAAPPAAAPGGNTFFKALGAPN